ncbi:hypothetical protein [Synechococcus sp. MIT S1220]
MVSLLPEGKGSLGMFQCPSCPVSARFMAQLIKPDADADADADAD